ncbi:MlaD family protein [Aldersonia kunmingensis]|uniref:MlaD family protein n=1 Tax=Aldersonia kunmingensis TaxID=408066 RepID=UPI0008343ED6|nr:MlaD family protein [Aldersonia kunmingensis]
MSRPVLRDIRSLERRQLRIGLAGIAVAVVLLLVCTLIYLNPFGHREFRADFETSGGLRVGDEVRIAGIQVGEVSAVDLHPDRVEVRFTVEDGVAVGDASSVHARLLTAIGGHYLALHPAGRESLGNNVIPVDRTSVPYTLADVINDSGSVVAKVDGVVISQTLAQVEAALNGQPEAIRQIIGGMKDLTTAVGAQEDDLDRAVALTEEYVANLDSGRAKLVELLRLIGYVGAKAYQVKAEGVETVKSIGAIFAFLGKPIYAFSGTIEPPFQDIIDITRRLGEQPAKIDDLLNTLRTIVARIAGTVGLPGQRAAVDASPVVIDAPAVNIDPARAGLAGICIPSPQKGC